MLGKRLQGVFFCALLLVPYASFAQTFELNNQAENPSKAPSKQSRPANRSFPAQASEGGIGWGSGIEVARSARAVQQALAKNDYRSAVAYATRAANAAPQNAGLWFLLGYSARLAGQSQVSMDAYQRGLKIQPSSIQGLSGLAQTYAKAGRQVEAQDALKKVLAANPKSVADLLLAGELSLAEDAGTALELLKRAEALRSSARSELLIARAYQRLNQPQLSKQFLDRAQSRAPKDPDVLRAVAGFYRDNKQYDLAIATLQKAAALPRGRSAFPELAYTYQVAGRKKAAAEVYSKAANNAPLDSGLQLSAAQALVNVGEFERATMFLKRAEAQDPGSYRLHAIRGQIFSDQGQNGDAIREYRMALEHLPSGVPEGPLYPISLHLSLYQLYQATEQNAAADGELHTAQAEMSEITGVEEASRPEFLRLRALLEAASKNFEAAEKDLKEALVIDPNNVNILLNYANLLWKIDRKQEAFQFYDRALAMEPSNHAALTAMGYLAREITDPQTAEKYFLKLASLYPHDYVPYLALGDLYTSIHEFRQAQENYEKAYEIAPGNPLIVTGGTNAGLEAHQLAVAKRWLDRGERNPSINQFPQVMRERERYLTWTGHYEESVALGYKVLEKLPGDPEAPVYLAYDLLFLNRYEEAAQVAEKYKAILPKDKDLWLISGYVDVHYNRLQNAVADFTKALELNPNVATTYMNRGFVWNDLKEPTRAALDFQAALRLRANYGEAHLGLAFAYVQLRRARPALREVDQAAKLMGESRATHLARAESFRQQVLLRPAEGEYRAALNLAPSDTSTRLALADTLYRLRRYGDSIEVLKAGLGTQNDGLVYAQMARDYAQLGRQADAMQAITGAEQRGGNSSSVLMATGEAWLIMGNNQAAMDRYARALEAPDADRVSTRLALARLFVEEGHRELAQQQVSLGFAEARVGEAGPITAEHLIEAAQLLASIAEFDLAKKFFERAQSAGADEQVVAIGLANTYLALGETQSAGQSLRSLGNSPDNYENYDYLIAMGNVYRQQQDTLQALAAFARANQLVQGNVYAERTELHLAEQEGRQLTENVSVHPELSFSPIFEDINIYTTDAKLRGITNPSLLPPPRSSFESLVDARYHIHLSGWPEINGLVEERNARGQISFPSELLIENRDTYDTIINGGVAPVWHLGSNNIIFNPGLQFTLRRDTLAPLDMNQNLFRQFLYVYTSPFFNWLSFSGNVIREAGPFTERNLHSRDASTRLEFTVGRPWGRTALITGYAARDVLFRPLIREYFTTSTYVGLQRKFGDNIKAAVFGEYLRSWRVQDTQFAIAQAIRPAFNFEYVANPHWTVRASGIWSRGQGFHAYDNVQNQILVSYVRSLEQPVHDGLGDVPARYPLRISFGLQQQTFYNFGGNKQNTVAPVVQLNLF
jgi:tetratricopeptide (TPR) repeat protein